MIGRRTITGVGRFDGETAIEAGNRRDSCSPYGVHEGLQRRQDGWLDVKRPGLRASVFCSSHETPRHPIRRECTLLSGPHCPSRALDLDAGDVEGAGNAAGCPQPYLHLGFRCD